MLAEKSTEEELRQIIATLESRVRAKCGALGPKITQAPGNKIAVNMAPKIKPKIETLNQQIGVRMRTAIAP